MAKHEYEVDEFVGTLSNTPRDSLVKTLCDDPGLLDALLRYSSLEQDKLIKYVNGSLKTVRFSFLSNVISLYPLTTNLVKALIQKNDDMPQDTENVVEWFDASCVMVKCFRKYMQLFNNCNFTEKKSALEDNIESNQAKSEILQGKIDEIKRLEVDSKNLHEQVNQLQKEYDTLNEEWSEDSLRNKKQKLERDIKRLKDIQEEEQQRLNIMKEHFESLSNVKNKYFEKALEAFGDVLETLGDDEEECNG